MAKDKITCKYCQGVVTLVFETREVYKVRDYGLYNCKDCDAVLALSDLDNKITQEWLFPDGTSKGYISEKEVGNDKK